MTSLSAAFAAVAIAGSLSLPAAAQQQRPQIETTKVEGTDNVYIFRNGNRQAMFIATRELCGRLALRRPPLLRAVGTRHI